MRKFLLAVAVLTAVGLGAAATKPFRRTPGGGGSSSSSSSGADVFDVRDYGANGDDASSDQTAFETAIEAAYDAGGGTVFFPRGTFYFERPFLLKSGVKLKGADKYTSILTPIANTWVGPLIIITDHTHDSEDNDDGLVFGAALVGDAGMSLRQDEDDQIATYLDLSQYYGMRLPSDAWSIEFWLKVEDDLTLGSALQPIFSCGGAIGGISPNSDDDLAIGLANKGYAMALFATDAAAMRFDARYNGSNNAWAVETATFTTLDEGETYHIELNWNGTAFRAFVDGELWLLGAQAPGAGADATEFKHFAWERCQIGNSAMSLQYASFSQQVGAAQTSIDGLRVSDSVRHTAGFTPPAAKYASDANTLLLLNFDEFYRDMVIGQHGVGGEEIYLRPYNANGCVSTQGVGMEDFRLVGSMGVTAEAIPYLSIERVYSEAQSDGWKFPCYGFFSSFRDISIVSNTVGRAAWHMGSQSDVVMSNIDWQAPLGVFLYAVNAFGENLTASITDGYYTGLWVGGGGTLVFDGYQADAEFANDEFLATLMVADPQSFTCNGCTIYGFDNTDTPLTVFHSAEPTSITINSPLIWASAATPYLRTFGSLASSFQNPIVITGPTNNSGAPLITGTKQGSVVDGSGIRRQQVAGITTDNAAVLSVPTDPIRESDYIVSATTLVTAHVGGNVGAEVVYTDCGGTARTVPLPGWTTAGASATVVASETVLNGAELKLCADPATTILVQSVEQTEATFTIQATVQRVSP